MYGTLCCWYSLTLSLISFGLICQLVITSRSIRPARYAECRGLNRVMSQRRTVVWSIWGDSEKVILLLCNSDIKGAGWKHTMKLKPSLIVVSRRAPGFPTVKYPDLNCLLCINGIDPWIRYNIRRARRVPLLFNWLRWLHCWLNKVS